MSTLVLPCIDTFWVVRHLDYLYFFLLLHWDEDWIINLCTLFYFLRVPNLDRCNTFFSGKMHLNSVEDFKAVSAPFSLQGPLPSSLPLLPSLAV